MTDAQLQHETNLIDSAVRLIEGIKFEHEIVMKHRETIKELEKRLRDATESDRRPKHYGYSFHTYDSADAAFIHSYLSRNREEYSDAQG